MRRIAVSVGCPCGVGPEVSVVAAAQEKKARVLLVGDAAAIAIAAKDGAPPDFSETDVRIALADLPKKDVPLLDAVLRRGTARLPPAEWR